MVRSLIAAIAAVTLAGAAAAQNQPAQQGARGRGPAAPHNLQVLPKDTSAQEVVAQMQQITRALGVQCTYCHIQVEPPPLSVEEQLAQQAAGRGRGRRGRGGPPPFDFASDEKPTKQTARVMLAMVRDINANLASSLHKPQSEIVKVQCATCHRGVTNPKPLRDLLAETMNGKGDSAAVSLYRELRQKYFGTEAYDFNDTVLVDLAREALANRKPDDALAWLQLNIEFYPNSAASYVELSRAHLAKRDAEGATKDLEKALALDPGNQQAKRELAALKRRS